MVGTSRILTLSTTFFSLPKPHFPTRVYQSLKPFKPRASFSTTTFSRAAVTTTIEDPPPSLEQSKHSILLDRLRLRHLKDSVPISYNKKPISKNQKFLENNEVRESRVFGGFKELGLSDEVLEALEEMGISVPTEIQGVGIPEVIEGKSVVLGSHTGSGKTLAYLLPLVQLLRQDEAANGMVMKPRRPRAVVLCPTRELCEQVFGVAKSISHHARFRSTMVSGGGRVKPQEEALNSPIDMVVGTPGRVLQHIEEGNLVYGDIKYLVLDEADTMFDRGFGLI